MVLGSFDAKTGPWSSVQSWHIHVGAHKTATTHLQNLLVEERERLSGAHLIVPQEILAGRLDYLVPRWQLDPIMPYWKVRQSGWTRHFARSRHLIDRLPPPPPRTRRVILSEENLLGPLWQVFGGEYYPMSVFNMSVIGRLAMEVPVTIFLSIRSPDTFFPSIYAEQLHHGPAPADGFRGIGQRILARPPSWKQLVRRIRRDAPSAKLRIWRYEDYRSEVAGIFKLVTGQEQPPDMEAYAPAIRRGGSAAAVAEAEQVDPAVPSAERKRRVAAIYANTDPEGPRFRPFGPEETAFLRRRYAKDLQDIKAFQPGAIVDAA